VLARHIRNRRLADDIYLWAFASLTASSASSPARPPTTKPPPGHIAPQRPRIRGLTFRTVGCPGRPS